MISLESQLGVWGEAQTSPAPLGLPLVAFLPVPSFSGSWIPGAGVGNWLFAGEEKSVLTSHLAQEFQNCRRRREGKGEGVKGEEQALHTD